MQNQKRAAGSSRRGSETLTLSGDTALAFRRLVERYYEDELKICGYGDGRPMEPWQEAGKRVPKLRRRVGNQLLALAVEAVMDHPGLIYTGGAW